MNRMLSVMLRRMDWEQPGTGRQLAGFFSIADRTTPEDIEELVDLCLPISSYELFAWLYSTGREKDLSPALSERIGAHIRENAHTGESINWSDLKAVVMLDRKDLFDECFLPWFRSAVSDRAVGEVFFQAYRLYISLLSDPHSKSNCLSEEELELVLSLSAQELANRRLINLRLYCYLAASLTDRELCHAISLGRSSFGVITQEERAAYKRLCELTFENGLVRSVRYFYRTCNSQLDVLAALELDPKEFLDRYLPRTASEDRNELAYLVREHLEKELGSVDQANEAWYGYISGREELQEEWFTLVYWLIRVASQPGREEENIRSMPFFTAEGSENGADHYRTYNLMNKFQRCLLETTPANILLALDKTAAFNVLARPAQIVQGKKEFAALSPEQLALMPEGCQGLLPFSDRKNWPNFSGVVSVLLGAGYTVKSIISIYWHTIMRAYYPLESLLKDLRQSLGWQRFRALDLRGLFSDLPIYAVIESTDRQEDIAFSPLSAGMFNFRRSRTDLPACANSLAGDIVRYKVTGFDPNRRRIIITDLRPLLPRDGGAAAGDMPRRTAWEQALEEIAAAGNVTPSQIDTLAAVPADYDHRDFPVLVRMNLLSARACAAVVHDRVLLDELLYLIQRKSNDQFSFNPLKDKRSSKDDKPFFLHYGDPCYEQALEVLSALCAREAPAENKLKVYMETALRYLIPPSDALPLLFSMTEGKEVSLADSNDPERYWFRCGVQQDPDRPLRVYQLEVNRDKNLWMVSERDAFEALPSFAYGAEVMCRLTRARLQGGLLREQLKVYYDRILPPEELGSALPANGFLDALYHIWKDGVSETAWAAAEQALCRPDVCLQGMQREYAILLLHRILISRLLGRTEKSMAEYDTVLRLAGERLPFTEGRFTDISVLRFPQLLPGGGAAVRALLASYSPQVALRYYMNSPLKAIVPLEELCADLLKMETGPLVREELSLLFERYPLLLAGEDGSPRIVNVLCRSFRTEGAPAAGMYAVSGYDAERDIISLRCIS